MRDPDRRADDRMRGLWRLGERIERVGVAGKLFLDLRRKTAFGGIVYRTRQGADASAMCQLPPGRRSPAPRRFRPLTPAAGRARRRWLRASADALPNLPPASQF